MQTECAVSWVKSFLWLERLKLWVLWQVLWQVPSQSIYITFFYVCLHVHIHIIVSVCQCLSTYMPVCQHVYLCCLRRSSRHISIIDSLLQLSEVCKMREDVQMAIQLLSGCSYMAVGWVWFRVELVLTSSFQNMEYL